MSSHLRPTLTITLTLTPGFESMSGFLDRIEYGYLQGERRLLIVRYEFLHYHIMLHNMWLEILVFIGQSFLVIRFMFYISRGNKIRAIFILLAEISLQSPLDSLMHRFDLKFLHLLRVNLLDIIIQ